MQRRFLVAILVMITGAVYAQQESSYSLLADAVMELSEALASRVVDLEDVLQHIPNKCQLTKRPHRSPGKVAFQLQTEDCRPCPGYNHKDQTKQKLQRGNVENLCFQT